MAVFSGELPGDRHKGKLAKGPVGWCGDCQTTSQKEPLQIENEYLLNLLDIDFHKTFLEPSNCVSVLRALLSVLCESF